MFEEIHSLEYDADREAEELRAQAEQGRQAKIVSEFMEDFLTEERAQTLFLLENEKIDKAEALLPPVLYLRVLRKLEARLQTIIATGEIAEKELNQDASEEDA